MAQFRAGRVGEQIKKEISGMIQSELKDPRIGFVTVTGVDVTGDLSLARVYLSIMGSEEQKEATLHAIGRAKGFLRSELGRRIRLRHTPDIEFRFDSSIEYGNHIEALLQQLNRESRDS